MNNAHGIRLLATHRLLRFFDGVANAVERLGQIEIFGDAGQSFGDFSSGPLPVGKAGPGDFGRDRTSANSARRDVPDRGDTFFPRKLLDRSIRSAILRIAAGRARPANRYVPARQAPVSWSVQTKSGSMPACFSSVWPICSPYKKCLQSRPVKDFLGAIGFDRRRAMKFQRPAQGIQNQVAAEQPMLFMAEDG